MVKKLRSNPSAIFAIIGLTSFIALTTAFTSEAFLGLEPCVFCIYQRYPFAIGIVLGLLGISLKNKAIAVKALLGLTSLNFFVNTGIAITHSGIERDWWQSPIEGCSVHFASENNGKSIFENLMSAPLGDCSKIPWQDPILGLSMANYNIGLCFGLAVLCLIPLLKLKRK